MVVFLCEKEDIIFRLYKSLFGFCENFEWTALAAFHPGDREELLWFYCDDKAVREKVLNWKEEFFLKRSRQDFIRDECPGRTVSEGKCNV